MLKSLLLISLVTAGCATTAPIIPQEYGFVDVPSERRIQLTYHNTSPNPICLSPERWPNFGGKINQASDRVYLVVGSDRFPIEDFNTGYCFKGCSQRVAPGSTVSTFISYDDFKLPDNLTNESKKLELELRAYRCTNN